MPCLGASVENAAARNESAMAPRASARNDCAGGTRDHASCEEASQLAQPTVITIGITVASLPARIAQRGIGRDQRYVVVRSSISSPTVVPTNIGARIARIK